MRYQSALGETVHAAANFQTGKTVTVQVLDIEGDALLTLTSNSAPESAVIPGLYTWASSDIDSGDQPTSYKELMVIFTDSDGNKRFSKIVVGGYPDQISFAEYANQVVVDVVNGSPGTSLGIGTARMPSDNITDAKTIADSLGISAFFIRGAVSLDAQDYSGYRFLGNDPLNDVLTLTSATDLDGATAALVQLTGTIQAGDLFCQNCLLSGLTGFSGIALQSTFIGTNVLKASTLFGTSILRSCFSALDNLLNSPIFSFAGLGVALQLQDYNGRFEVRNMTHASALFEANMGSGLITLHSSNTNGQATVRGNAQITDNSAGTAVTDQTTHALTLESTEHQGVAGSLGYTVATNLDATVSSRESESSASTRATTDQAEHDATQAAIAAMPNAGAIADAVWDEPLAGHLSAGSTGEKLNSGSALDPQDVADAVWDAPMANHLDAGTTGEALNNVPTADETAQQVEKRTLPYGTL